LGLVVEIGDMLLEALVLGHVTSVVYSALLIAFPTAIAWAFRPR
jgi:hypothetical protein